MPLLHLSISAADPQRVARFLALLLGGEALPFPPFPGSWIAFSAVDDGTAIEVYPDTHRIVAGPQTIDCQVADQDASPTFCHAAIASPLPAEGIMALGGAEGWTTRACDRGPFACIEIWIEDRLLVEVLDPAMLRDYRRGMTTMNWRRMFHLSGTDAT